MIRKPTLLVDAGRARANLARMAKKAKSSGVRFRPHFKTHQSHAVGEMFREYGVKSITVSSVDMADYFAQAGWDDITIAFPVNILQIEEINTLAKDIRLGLLVESQQSAGFLAGKIEHEVDIWIKTDVGSHRTGIPWEDTAEHVRVAQEVVKSPLLTLRGLLAHAGHSYGAGSKENVIRIFNETSDRLNSLRVELMAQGILHVEISVGDTPSSSVLDDFGGVDEIRPGNFIYYDITQLRFGSCEISDIAAAVACPVVAVHPKRNQIILYGGAVHLSKEYLTREDGTKSYGAVTYPEGSGWSKPIPNTYVSSLSQEHGTITTSPDIAKDVRVGDVLIVLPVHSCLSANLLQNDTMIF